MSKGTSIESNMYNFMHQYGDVTLASASVEAALSGAASVYGPSKPYVAADGE
jgi:hypothetical protein